MWYIVVAVFLLTISVMSTGKVWAVSSKGNVYTLSTSSRHWEPVSTTGQHLRGFKRVSATRQGAWGLGCDHQVYVHVEDSDVPIRCQEVTFENEVGLPLYSCSYILTLYQLHNCYDCGNVLRLVLHFHISYF